MNLGLEKLQSSVDQLGKVPSQYRLVGVFLIPLLLGGLYFQLLFAPARAELKRLNGRQQDLQRNLNEVRSVAANIDAFEQELTNLEGELTVAVRQLPNSKELPGLLTDITSLGKNAGLEFKAFVPQREISRGFYAEVPIDIEFTGRFHEVAAFFDEVARLPRIVNIAKLKMSIKNEGLLDTTLKVTGRATTFRFVDRGGKA